MASGVDWMAHISMPMLQIASGRAFSKFNEGNIESLPTSKFNEGIIYQISIHHTNGVFWLGPMKSFSV
jgi:hypothetical protein